jgi:futalosine hydrolase
MLNSGEKDHSLKIFAKVMVRLNEQLSGYLRMLLLLVSATTFEIRETIQWLDDNALHHKLWKSDLLISGIGQLQTTYALQKKAGFRRPDLVIQAGFGGGQNSEDIGKVYAIGSEQMADLGAIDRQGFLNLFELGLEKPDKFPYKNGKLINPYLELLEWTGLPVLDGITVNEIKSADFAGFQRNNRPIVESMEGAALHYVCLMENIPFLQIRSVSNVTGDRDKTRWKLKEAGQNLHNSLVCLIQKLEKANENLFRV